MRNKDIYAKRHDLTIIGNNVRRIRQSMQISQEVLAEKAGISPVSVARIEGGTRGISMDVLISLTKALETTPNEILAGITEEVKADYNVEFAKIVKDCSDYEKRLIIGIAEGTRDVLRRNPASSKG